MTSTTPLLTRIAERRTNRIGPVAPLPRQISQRMSEFSRRLAEKRLPVKDWYNGAVVPDGDGGAA